MKIYTKVGDGGKTLLFGGEKVWKDHPRVMAYGDVDELNSLLGWAICLTADGEILKILTRLQNELFVLGADLATPRSARLAKRVPRVGPRHIRALEKGHRSCFSGTSAPDTLYSSGRERVGGRSSHCARGLPPCREGVGPDRGIRQNRPDRPNLHEPAVGFSVRVGSTRQP
jgi:cob(I)alamin adenosyltransferase